MEPLTQALDPLLTFMVRAEGLSIEDREGVLHYLRVQIVEAEIKDESPAHVVFLTAAYNYVKGIKE